MRTVTLKGAAADSNRLLCVLRTLGRALCGDSLRNVGARPYSDRSGAAAAEPLSRVWSSEMVDLGNRRTVDPAMGGDFTGSKANEAAQFVMGNDAGAGTVFEPAGGDAELCRCLRCIEQRFLDGCGRGGGRGGHAFSTGDERGVKFCATQRQPATVLQWHQNDWRAAHRGGGGGNLFPFVLGWNCAFSRHRQRSRLAYLRSYRWCREAFYPRGGEGRALRSVRYKWGHYTSDPLYLKDLTWPQ